MNEGKGEREREREAVNLERRKVGELVPREWSISWKQSHRNDNNSVGNVHVNSHNE